MPIAAFAAAPRRAGGMEKYLDLLLFALAGVAFPLLAMAGGIALRRRYPDVEKERAYESGELPIGDARIRFHISYYVFALVFLVFDIESVFLYPWAVVYLHLSRGLAFGEILVFVGILLAGWLYAWKKRVLTWV
jgi:NADH-quinone oxidoreductase subunit A